MPTIHDKFHTFAFFHQGAAEEGSGAKGHTRAPRTHPASYCWAHNFPQRTLNPTPFVLWRLAIIPWCDQTTHEYEA
tara:strand:+ start:2778 stop:3005 length:228 start_codon:yes stop_codon:yes gene_type:complete